jgi:D-sedoheptulose 7-phosphate isomerase
VKVVQMKAAVWKEYSAATAVLLDQVDPAEVQALVDAIVDAYRAGEMVFLIGNGGSGANASHLCEDLGKGTLTDFEEQRRLRVMRSGNSANVLHAIEYANAHGMRTFGICGYDGGALKGVAQQSLHVRSHDMGMVEAVHGVVFHYLVDVLRQAFAKVDET